MSDEANALFHIPEDVFTSILLKLPVKSILTSTCVSKTWNSIIKSPEFFASHLNRTILASYEENDVRLCLLQLCTLPVKSGRDSFFLRSSDREFSLGECLYCPYKYKYGFQIVASCNGLVCLMHGKYNCSCCRIRLILWNPVIRKSVILNEYLNLNALEAVGVGFDSRTGDYKVLTLIEELGNETTLMVKLYSLKANSWKWLPNVEALHERSWNVHRAMTYLNGALYFVALRRLNRKPKYSILGFDLSDEVFHEILLPDCITNDSNASCFWGSHHFYLWTYGESLAVLWFRDSIEKMQIWVMKEYGVEGSWAHLSTIRLEGLPNTRNPLSLAISGLVFTKDDHVLFSVGSYRSAAGWIFSHDLKSQETKEIIHVGKNACIFLGDYVESLVLLDKGNDLTDFESESGAADDTSKIFTLKCRLNDEDIELRY